MSVDAFTLLGLVSIVFVIVGAVGLVLSRQRKSGEIQQSEAATPITEWKGTGHIDFACLETHRDGPAFVLRAEEYRITEIATVSGAKRVEFRWRNASLEEAKRVVSRHNASIAAMNNYLPWSVRAPRIVPDDEPVTEDAAKPVLELISPAKAARR